MQLIKSLPDEEVPTKTAVVGIARAGHCRAGNGVIYSEILNHLNTLKSRKNNANEHDALIGEVAIKREWFLLQMIKA